MTNNPDHKETPVNEAVEQAVNEPPRNEVPAPETPAEEASEKKASEKKAPRPMARTCAWISIVFPLLALAAIIFNEWICLGCSIVAIVTAIFGLRQPRSNMRNLAITSLVAAAVLLLDILIILGAIEYLKTL